MKILFEDKDYLDATEPFYNGCAFRLLFKKDDTIRLEPGCYCLINLIQGAKKYFYNKWLDNKEQPFKIEVSPETKQEMLSRKPCRYCGAPYFEEKI